MKYQQFGSLDWAVSVLGFSVMRYAMLEGREHPDQKSFVNTVRHALDRGVNYLDLSYLQHAADYEEIAGMVNETLKDGYRDKVKVAVSLPTALIGSAADLDLYLEKQLNCLRVGAVDFCLFEGINRINWPRLESINVLDWADRVLKAGKVQYLGFSFYDHNQVLHKIVEAYDKWTFCQLQFSYVDIDRRPGIGGLKYAAEKGLAVVLEQPLRGGRLLKRPAGEEFTGLQADDLLRLALRWAWSHPEAATVLCNLSSPKQVDEYIALAESADRESLSFDEKLLINRISDAYRRLKPVRCNTCYGCMPCPRGIDIPRIIELYNDAFAFDDVEIPRLIYRIIERHNAADCTGCGACTKACARKFPIPQVLRKTCKLFGEVRPAPE